MSLLAGCSNCDFSRRFSPELAGRYYRCPRCREGVIAVPAVAAGSGSGSGSRAGLALSSSSFEFPLALEEARRKRQAQHKETEDVTALDATALDTPDPASASARPETQLESSQPPVLDSAVEDSLDLAGKVLGEDPTNHRGQVGEARRILVECGLCGFHVRIPVEFFGKTVHCPECAGNTMFTESTLEPVKDELLDRLALETTERDALYRGKERRRLPAWLRSPALRSFLLGVGLGLLVLAIVFGALRLRG